MATILPLFFVFLTYRQKKITIVSDTAYAPFEFKDSDQVYKGIDVDLITEVAKRCWLGLYDEPPSFDAAVNAVQAGQADAIMAGMTITKPVKSSLPFPTPYYDTKIVLYTALTKRSRIIAVKRKNIRR